MFVQLAKLNLGDGRLTLKIKISLCLLALSHVLPCTSNAATTDISDTEIRQKAKVFGTIPERMPHSGADTAQQIALGKMLYFETALSVNRTQSCNSCHNLLNGGHGVDHLKTPTGATGVILRRNVPSTFNAGFQHAQNWDSVVPTLEAQAQRVLLSPDEMALPSEAVAVQRVKDKYLAAFEKAFPNSPDPVSFANIAAALAAFQRTLITEDRFDQFIAGNDNALTITEKKGFLQFLRKGCAACHSGPMMGGQFDMKIGLVIPYPNTQDKGIAEITGRQSHEYLFKVPILRNVANTWPYFHDGQGSSLEDAVFLTGWHQLGQKMNDQEVTEISAFLRSLNNTKPYKD